MCATAVCAATRQENTTMTDQPRDDDAVRRTDEATDDSDTEGHAFLVDPISSRQIARDRSAEIERAARERQRQKEARPNR
jgi:hypothetical protein